MIQANNISLSRDNVVIVPPLNLHLAAGKITVILGPNGAGKTTLLQLLGGFIPADSGTLQLEGKPYSSFSIAEFSTNVAWQGALPPVDFGLIVEERLELAKADGPLQLDQVAQSMHLTALLQRDMACLSSGERQRVELAAILYRHAPVWLLDEPTSHLDLKHQVSWLKQLRRAADGGITVAVVLHDLNQARAIADQVVLLPDAGEIQVGTAESSMNVKQLSELFDVRLMRYQKKGSYPALLADYRNGSSWFKDKTP